MNIGYRTRQDFATNEHIKKSKLLNRLLVLNFVLMVVLLFRQRLGLRVEKPSNMQTVYQGREALCEIALMEYVSWW